MKRVDFLFVGAAKDSSYKTLEASYLKKITHYADTELTILKDSAGKDLSAKQAQDTTAILAKLKPGDVLIVCDERGKNPDTKTFATKLGQWRTNGKRVVFVIGGAYGFTQELRAKADFVLQLSTFTLPHELARVVLLEQVYRAFTVLAGEKYHHE
jgi:23S rRNA (pseudouridine1915-N3)-methyltransferase